MTSTTHTYHLNTPGSGPVDLTVAQEGDGYPFLLLHGGAGPQSMAGFAQLLAANGALAVIPTHPGFAGTERPVALDSVRGLSELYMALLEELDLTNVTVVGNSVGGWAAAEVGLLGSPRVDRVILVDATGIEVPGCPVADVFSMSLDQVFHLSYHNPAPFLIDPSTLPPAARATAAGNMAALGVYAGKSSTDKTLLSRLSGMNVSTLVVWGKSDRIVSPDYGRAYADAIPTAQFVVLPATGHLPQLEAPDRLMSAIRAFIVPGSSEESPDQVPV